jgi:hydroxymethylglutaryl-CoA reductase
MSSEQRPTSRISGFHKHSVEQRLALLFEGRSLSEDARAHLRGGGQVDVDVVDRMSENVIACQSLPLSVGLNFRINRRDVLVPMAVEEPSIVAAASNAARLVRISGGFTGDADSPCMTAQVQLDEVPNPEAAKLAIEAAKQELLAYGNQAIPRMVERGGGCRDLEARVVDIETGMVVVHFYVDVGHAMGANMVDQVAEHVAPEIQRRVGGIIGLRILSNLPLRRMVRAKANVSAEALGGEALADGIARASRFAEKDIFRAVTHNKGVMNGIDAVAVALGQDWRSIEAGAHAYAALKGGYRPIATWARTEDGLEGKIELPLAVATVGGSTRVHQGVRAAFELLGIEDAKELAVVMAAAGLACNLAALRALAGEGIQKGHMKLHHRKEEAEAEISAVGEG